jgi:uncharacterized protein (TIGR03067 family)
MRSGFLALAVVLLLAGGARADDAKDIEGTWIPTTGELGGQPLPAEILRNMKLSIQGDKYAVRAGAETDFGTLKLDPVQKPKAIDITGTDGPNKGKTIPAIYELSGDSLRVCYALTGTKRPAEFTSKGDAALLLITYKRVKQ